MYDSEVLEYTRVKLVDFTNAQSWAILLSKMVRGLGRVLCWIPSLWRHVGAKSLFTFIPFLPPKRIVEREKHV